MDVIRVVLDDYGRTPMVLLRETQGQRQLPIWIGRSEARAIELALEGIVAPRPLTHDLFAEVLSELGHHDLEGRITQMDAGVFAGELEVDGHTIAARPSDLVALAVRTGMKLTASEELLDQVGVTEEPTEDENAVEQFKEFLDHVNADDFEG